MLHMTCDKWQAGGGASSLKFQLPSSYGLGVKVFWRYFQKEWVTEKIYEWQWFLWNSPGPGLLIM